MELLDIVYDHEELNRMVVDEVLYSAPSGSTPLISASFHIKAHCISVSLRSYTIFIWKSNVLLRNGATTSAKSTGDLGPFAIATPMFR